MMFELIKVIRDTRDNIGVPAKTDFIKIYIDEDVSHKEYDVLFKHEQAHIWLEHNKRIVKGMKKEIWDVSCELEIARNIYDENDITIIKAPFSSISKGFVPDTIQDLPKDVLIAEEIYDWLLKNQKEQPENKTCNCSKHSEKTIDNKISKIEAEKIIKEAKEKIEDMQSSKIAEKNTKINLKEIKSRKPSLSSELDAVLRMRIERDKSYRRPSRKENIDHIEKGKVTVANSPLVEIFIDRSGSFTPEKTKLAQKALEIILKRYNSSIKYDVWFFGSGKISSKDFCGGDTPYHLIQDHLLITKPKIAIVVTDNDQCDEMTIKVKTIVMPINCTETNFAKKSGAIDVSW